LQTLGKQEQATNNNPVKKHQKAQLQPQDPNPPKSNQTTIKSIQRTKKQATTSPPGMMQFQSRLQNPKRANCNKTNICNLHRLQIFVCYFILIVFYGQSTAKQCNNRSNCGCNTPTLQTLGKEEQATNKKPVKNHQKAQLQPQDPNPAKSNQTTINNIQRTKKQATTSPPGMTQFQSRLQVEPQTCKLQQDEQANKNNNNRQIRNQWRCKKQAWTSEATMSLKHNIAQIDCREHCI
jgi:hypothetical protein